MPVSQRAGSVFATALDTSHLSARGFPGVGTIVSCEELVVGRRMADLERANN